MQQEWEPILKRMVERGLFATKKKPPKVERGPRVVVANNGAYEQFSCLLKKPYSSERAETAPETAAEEPQIRDAKDPFWVSFF